MTNLLRRGATAAMVAVLVSMASACVGAGGAAGGAGDGEQAAATPGPTQMVNVTLADFSIIPSSIDALAGRSLMFMVSNQGSRCIRSR
jgi:hypothetical protein